MRRHAEDTKVPVSQTRAEIERMVEEHGATGYSLGWEGDTVALTFDLGARRIRFLISVMRDEPEQSKRAAWRRLRLSIKAKLEAVADGARVEEVFLGETVIPRTGKTVAETLLPQLHEAYRIGGVPPLLQLPAAQLALPCPEDTRLSTRIEEQ
jgi:hypothetical protein